MPGIDRTTIIQGPALVTYGGQTFWSKGDVTVTPVLKRFSVESSAFGKLEDRNIDLRIDVSFEPAGQFTTELAAVLWPYAGSAPGTALYGASDAPLVVWGRAGDKLTLANAALTQMPNVRFGVAKTTLGQIKFTGLVANSSDPSTLASYWAWASAGYPGDTGFSTDTIWTRKPISAWGITSPWDAFETEAGWEISFPMQTADVAVDGIGTVGMRLVSVAASAVCIPVGPTAAQVLTALHGGLAMGVSPAKTTLSVSAGASGSPILTMAASLAAADTRWGATAKRVGQCTWTAVRTFSEYVPAVVSPAAPAVEAAMLPLFTIAEVPA